MGKSGYIKCSELLSKLLSEGKTSMTENELKTEIAKNIGYSKAHDTIMNNFNAMLLFKLIKQEGDKLVINKDELNG